MNNSTALSYSRIAGANDRIQLGLIGAGNRGTHVMSLFQKNPSVQVAAVCDVYGQRVDAAQQKAPGAKGFSDHRKMLEMRELNVVLVGTPDHWHAVTAIDAMEAGKDVYVEKPLMRLREEGPRIVKAARVNERICQVGLQQRSGWPYIRARDEFVKPGKLGKITLARTWWHGVAGRSASRPMTMEKPSNLDWARFLGPVGWHEWNPRMYFNFRAFLEFNGGIITDFFTHWVDAVHMMLDIDNPTAIMAAGGIYLDTQYRTAPDNAHCLVEYPSEVTVTFGCARMAAPPEYGIELCGTEGRLFVNRNRIEFQSAEKGSQPDGERRKGDITLDHVNNFLDCCSTRKRPNGDVSFGQRSTQVSLLCVQAYVEKRLLHFDPVREEVLPL